MKEESKNDSEYVRGLENIVKAVFSSLESVPLKTAIESAAGKKVIKFDKENSQHNFILRKLCEFAYNICQINKSIMTMGGREKEISNWMFDYNEPDFGFGNLYPIQKVNNKKQNLHYPHYKIELDDLYIYVTIKTFTKENKSSENVFTVPEVQLKAIDEDALHFIISFEVELENNSGSGIKRFSKVGWKVLQIENVSVRMKYDFVFDNKKIYLEENILAEDDK